MEIQGQSVIVTGGASGIGKATALLLAREGARIFIGDVDEAGGQAAAAEAVTERLSVEYLPLDLTAPSRSRASQLPFISGRIGSTAWSMVPVGTRSSRSSKTRRRCGIVSSRSI